MSGFWEQVAAYQRTEKDKVSAAAAALTDEQRRNIRLWVEALRSGRYAQGLGLLRSDDGKFCCLGVACEVAITAGVPVRRSASPVRAGFGVRGYAYSDGREEASAASRTSLPPLVQRWLGLLSDQPAVALDKVGVVTAGAANDSYGWSFDRIADELERLYLSEPPGVVG